MIPIEPAAQQALDSNTGLYRTRIIDIAVALAHQSITKTHIEQAHQLVLDQNVEPKPKIPSLIHYTMNQFGSLLAGGAVGAILVEPKPTQYLVIHTRFAVSGFALWSQGMSNHNKTCDVSEVPYLLVNMNITAQENP
jgi:hypothetical protein